MLEWFAVTIFQSGVLILKKRAENEGRRDAVKSTRFRCLFFLEKKGHCFFLHILLFFQEGFCMVNLKMKHVFPSKYNQDLFCINPLFSA